MSKREKLFKERQPLIWWTECEATDTGIIAKIKYRANVHEMQYVTLTNRGERLNGENSFSFSDAELIAMLPYITDENAYMLVNALRSIAKKEQLFRSQINKLISSNDALQAIAVMERKETLQIQQQLAKCCALQKYKKQFVSHRL